MDEIKRLDIKIGDTVIVERAGDVIPAVKRVLKNLRPKNAKSFKMPSRCLVCEAPIKKEGVYFRCINKNCPALQRRNLYHFTSRGAFDIVGLGPKILDRLYDEGLIQDAADIFELKEEDIAYLERFGEKSAENLIKSINEAKKITLARLIFSLGILHVGDETATDLAEHFGNLEKIISSPLEELEQVPNIGEVVARSIHNWFNTKSNGAFIGKLLNKGLKIQNPSKKSKKLVGKKFVFTGELENLNRSEAESLVRKHSGNPSSSVSKNTDYVIAGRSPGSKYNEARKLGVKILNEKEFIKLINKE
jgi:DNA ligase (NAD+)